MPHTPDRKCLHCEVGHLVEEFIKENPEYSKAEMAADLMKISSQFIEHCISEGIDLGRDFLVIDEREPATKH